MSKQVWGTFSVKDHCADDAFVAEVLLYDRLVVPVPPDDAERERWRAAGWQPERLDALLTILGERAYPVPWDGTRQASWLDRYSAGSDVAQATGDWAFAATRSELTEGLPRHVTGVEAVAHYSSLAELEQDLALKPAGEHDLPLYGGTAAGILGHAFLVPANPNWDHAESLREAVALSSERAARHKRAAFWRWQREFMGDTTLTDQAGVVAALEEMQDLLAEEQAIARRKWAHTATRFAFLIGSVSLGLLGGPLTAVAAGGAFVSVGEFIADKLLEPPGDGKVRPTALLRDNRKHFGWR